MEATEILKNIEDPRLKKQIGDILSRKTVKQIRCMSKKCKGRVIGYIQDNGAPVENKKEGSTLMGIRTRFDGQIGCQCLCGNDSRLSKHEKGVIKAHTPTKKDLYAIFDKMKKDPQEYETNEVDGFIIEDCINGV